MRRLTLTLARPSGISVEVHLSWLLLAGWAGWAAAGLPRPAALKLLLLFVLMVACVLLHELAHAFAGRAAGLHAARVTLYPFGGLSTFEDLHPGEARTALVFLAGPAANLLLAGFLWLSGGNGPAVVLGAPAASDPVSTWLLWFNLSLGLLNLVPALPLDGGRIVQTLLARRMGELGAGRVLGIAGQTAGIVLLVWGLGGRPWLVLLGLVLLLGATAELQRIHPLLMARRHKVRDVMRRDIVAVDSAVSCHELREISRRSPGSDFLVLEEGRPVAYLPAARLWTRPPPEDGLAARALGEPLGPALDPGEPLARAAANMKAAGSKASAVIGRDGQLEGVLLEAGAHRSIDLLEALSRHRTPDRR